MRQNFHQKKSKCSPDKPLKVDSDAAVAVSIFLSCLKYTILFALCKSQMIMTN